MERMTFHNTGPDQLPGVIVMSISDMVGEDLDPNHQMIVVIFNATPEDVTIVDEAVAGYDMTLHPILVESNDPIVGDSAFDASSGTFNVPGLTTAVFVLAE